MIYLLILLALLALYLTWAYRSFKRTFPLIEQWLASIEPEKGKEAALKEILLGFKALVFICHFFSLGLTTRKIAKNIKEQPKPNPAKTAPSPS